MDRSIPLINEIISRGPHISTSWFNYGVCVSALGRNGEAADKFLKAYELEPENYGAQYRAFRCLFEARDYDRFLQPVMAWRCNVCKFGFKPLAI